LVCGIWGTLAVGIFGIGEFSFLTQLIGVAAIGAFTFTFTFALFFVLKKTVGIRVSEEHEEKGLDISEHDMQAYQGAESTTYDMAVE
jgi:Amt family ammonium transporter